MAMASLPLARRPSIAVPRREMAPSITWYMLALPTGWPASVLSENAKSSWISPITM